MYRVLARKYRPATFADLIGQEVLVRTLTHAIERKRIAHAFLLTGIRGIGKTTTARIMARALNCIGADGQGKETVTPCGVCPNCVMVAEDRHPDVIEMDAASRTGVDNMRELIDTVHYAPGSARYKIYIIDEVHMLSTSAFNALLKTLEEPPPHVKFIFATTEVRKIPVTILSRCQRFDLKRVEQATLEAHLQKIAGKESVTLEPEAGALIAIAAEGSVRDSLSLMDQAIVHGEDKNGQACITAQAVRAMMGMNDASQTLTLFERLAAGEVPEALAQLEAMYTSGADITLVLQDLLELTHVITRAKIAPATADDVTLTEQVRSGVRALSEKMSVAGLSLIWQMLVKGLQEVRLAPSPKAAAEMILVRTAYAQTLPKTAEALAAAPPRAVAKPAEAAAMPEDFAGVVALFGEKKEMILSSQLQREARLVRFEAGSIELQASPVLTREVFARVAQCLTQWTGMPWKVLSVNEPGAPTLHEQAEARRQEQAKEVAAHPLVASVLEHFPGAQIKQVVNS